MNKMKNNIPILRSSAAEYLTYVANVGGEKSAMEMCYENENNPSVLLRRIRKRIWQRNGKQKLMEAAKQCTNK